MNQIIESETYLRRENAKDERMARQAELSAERLMPARALKSLAMNLAEGGEFSPEVLPRGKSKGCEKGEMPTVEV